ncbi:O-antigen ligase family protein [Capillimicrobium parvum]|uniref:O-antigen ligase-related domain-containing protein n=1 Tax=Capillimicrobium parvum TaxID=2884022 RepID=A0A9E6Y0Z1_9ACTN|nr:O-antigen ligase family protein [Capillimicrobium parvum]UGS37416.1 hypothetical protein DSM104329_03832 [Capillimicrobium parvum]
MELRDPPAQALRRGLAGAARVALLAGPTVIAFRAGGYFEETTQVAGIVAWIVLAILAVVVDGHIVPRTLAARLALGGIAAFSLWVLLSRLTWAPLDGPAGEDVQRDALYVAVLVAGALAWRPREWARSVEAVLALGILVVVGYGVLGRVLPGLVELHPSRRAGGRLDQPLTYWNAMGALAAMGVVLCARMAGDRLRELPIRAAAAAAAAPLGLGLYLTYSRGALAAVGCGLIVLGLLAPTRPQLRGIVVVLGAAFAASLAGSLLDGVASVKGSLSHQEKQGLVMLVVLVVVMAAAAGLQAWVARRETAQRLRDGRLPLPRWALAAGWAAAIALALFPYAAAVVSERGEENPSFGATAARLSSVGSNRYAYWRVAFREFVDHPLKGTGAASFRVDWLQERPFRESVRDAHSLYFETLAELGIVGFGLLCALLAGVLIAIRRVMAEDAALAVGPAAALAVWAVHAGVDWDWEMPAVTLVALTLAGMLLARCEALPRSRAAAGPPPPASPPPG